MNLKNKSVYIHFAHTWHELPNKYYESCFNWLLCAFNSLFVQFFADAMMTTSGLAQRKLDGNGRYPS